jgi:hypothetical protein
VLGVVPEGARRRRPGDVTRIAVAALIVMLTAFGVARAPGRLGRGGREAPASGDVASTGVIVAPVGSWTCSSKGTRRRTSRSWTRTASRSRCPSRSSVGRYGTWSTSTRRARPSARLRWRHRGGCHSAARRAKRVYTTPPSGAGDDAITASSRFADVLVRRRSEQRTIGSTRRVQGRSWPGRLTRNERCDVR